MDKRNDKETGQFSAGPNEWQARHEGDWQLAESNEEDTAILLTSQADPNEKQPLYAAGGNPDDEDKDKENEEEEEEDNQDNPRDWGHTDPLDSPFPDSTDPSGPGSAV